MFEFESDIQVVGEAANGDEAVSMTDTLHPDVVLLDLSMPEMNGLEALPLIHDQHPEVKVLILTGTESEQLRSFATELGAVDYIIKGTPASLIAQHMRVAVGA